MEETDCPFCKGTGLIGDSKPCHHDCHRIQEKRFEISERVVWLSIVVIVGGAIAITSMLTGG